MARSTSGEKPFLRHRLFSIIFGTNTRAGRLFDLGLLWLILASILIVCLESVPSLRAQAGSLFWGLELFFTGIFTVELALRLYCHPKPLRYFFSFYGLVDLLSIVPTYLLYLAPASHYLVTIRVVRLLRVFRILKLTSFVHHAETLRKALLASFYKISVFLLSILSLVLIIGTLMYVIEGEAHGFTSIPMSMYWAIVTITTVGYGDVTPQTPLGQMLSSLVMILGYSIIAVPTGIVTVELSKSNLINTLTKQSDHCASCGEEVSDTANYCSHCGHKLH